MKHRFISYPLLLSLAAAFLVSPLRVADADDAWLVADPTTVQVGDKAWLGFVGGQVFPLSETIVTPDDMESMFDLCDGEARPITGTIRAATGCREEFDRPGIHVIAGQMLPQTIEMSGTQFDDYLSEERAAAAILERLSDDPDAVVVEEYTRYAKTILNVGSVVPDNGYAAIAGHRLEIVPLSDPSLAQPGDRLSFEVLLDGYRWEGVPLSACREGFETRTFVAETLTDETGQAEIEIDSAGPWLIRAHFIRRTDGLRKADWESFWATLTFRVGDNAASFHNNDAVMEMQTNDEVDAASANNDADSGNPPLTLPLDELYGFFSSSLRTTNNKAA